MVGPIPDQSELQSPIYLKELVLYRANYSQDSIVFEPLSIVATMSIRTDVSDIPEGTSTIQSQLLSGRHHFRATVRCCHTVNPRTIKCQSITSMMPFMCQSIAIPVLVNCQSISDANIQPICHSNAYPKLICQSANLNPILQSNATWTISQSPNAPSTHLSAPIINTGLWPIGRALPRIDTHHANPMPIGGQLCM